MEEIMKCNLLKVLLLTAMAAPLSLAAVATTWYVNGVTGNNSNNCLSTTTACKTIGHAISLAHSGDSIRVAAATYYENPTIRISLNIIGAGAIKTIIDGRSVKTVVTIFSTGANVMLSNLTIRSGVGVSGGGIYNSGQLTITGSTVSGNSVFHGSGSALGGGLYNSGTVTINRSTFNNNAAATGSCTDCGAFGGGIYNSGTLTVNNSTFSGNSAVTNCSTHCFIYGGGIDSDGMFKINNSTFSGNKLRFMLLCRFVCLGNGAAISGTGSGTISNSTIAGNSALYLGGVGSNVATLQNTIMADNSGGNCGTVRVTSKGYNLSSDGTCALTGPGDMNNTDPMLGPLQGNGGPTQTMELLPGSPAIDAGNPSGCTDSDGNLLKTDQRGMPRPDEEDNGGCDIGAYESQSVN
jgi:hypothetical protein